MKKLNKAITAIAAVTVVGLGLAGCSGGGNPLSGGGGNDSKDSITIGSQNFPENELIGEMYAQALENNGVTVTRKFNIGAREVLLAALKDGSIDVIPEYNGALLGQLLKNGAPEGVTTGEQINKELEPVLPKGLEMLPMSAAEDKDVLAVTKETASKYKLKSIADLKPYASQMTVGAGPGWDTIYQGLVGLEDKYGLKFANFKALDAGGPLTIKALENGDVQAADLFSTDPTIASGEFVSLEDPNHLFLAENIFPLIRSVKVDSKVKDALNGVSDKLTTENLTKYLAEVITDKKSTKAVATEFLKDNGLAK